MKELRGKRVLITGAASGIGRGAAHAFAREGSSLLLWDTDTAGLASLERELQHSCASCLSFQVDVADAESVRETADRIANEHGGVDVLVNVAGVCVVADVVDIPLEDWHWVMGVNLWGPIHTISAFLPEMLSRGSGHIVNVSSAGGLVGFGLIASYCTTKFALVGLGEGLAQEVRDRGVGVTTICPGLTNTSIVRSARWHGYDTGKVTRVIELLMSLPGAMSPEKTGRLIVRAVRRNSPLVVTTLFAKALVIQKRFFPRSIGWVLRKIKILDDRLFKSTGCGKGA